MSKERKKFKETRIGKFLKEKAPDILDTIGEFLPEKGGLGFLKNVIQKHDKLTPEDKEFALKELEFDVTEMEEMTKRWQADMTSDSWLSKNSRPIVLLYSWFLITLITILAFFDVIIPTAYTGLIEALCIAVNVAYFGSRGFEKYQSIKNK